MCLFICAICSSYSKSVPVHGGIPDRDLDGLVGYWDAFPNLRTTLFTPNRPGYSNLAVEVNSVQQTILDSDEFKKFAAEVAGQVGDWFATQRPMLQAIGQETVPSQLIATIGDDPAHPVQEPMPLTLALAQVSVFAE
jgi:type I restriction enzyme M protein